MINLIPEEYKEKIRHEYRMRFFAVISLFAFFALGISVIALLPGAFSVGADYFLARQSTPKPIVPEEDSRLKQLNTSLQSFRETLAVLDLKKENTPVLLSELMRLIALQKPEKVSLESYSFIVESETMKKLVLSGVAHDRESLVAFSKRLSENKTFSQVDFPISNLSKKENIEFSVTLSMKQAKKEEAKEAETTE